MKINAFFYSHPVFRYDEFACWKEEQGIKSVRTPRNILLYHVNAGHLVHVKRGIYAVVPPDLTPDEISVDPYLLASKAATDSVLAYHSALELHGVVYSVFGQFTFLSSQKIKPFEYSGQWFKPVIFPLALKKANAMEFGVEQIDRQGMLIKVTNLARTFVDVLDRIEMSGGWEEVIRSISNMATLDVNAVIEYCLLLDSRILAAKVGFFLEQRQGAFAVSDTLLNPLLKKIPLTPQSLVAREREGGKLIKKWNLILPLNVINKSWEEPNDNV